ncbi:hypothetical protein D3C83_29290 [compost metagenome]
MSPGSRPFFIDLLAAASTAPAGMPMSPASTPSAIMFGHAPGIAAASFFSGTGR